jgi:FixJ family two-component response regulator
MSGLEFRKQLQKAVHRIPIISITYGDIQMIVKAMKFGVLKIPY